MIGDLMKRGHLDTGTEEHHVKIGVMIPSQGTPTILLNYQKLRDSHGADFPSQLLDGIILSTP